MMGPTTIFLHKASPTGEMEVPSVIIEVYRPLPDPEKVMGDALLQLYTEDAHKLAIALRQSLPQATLERLTVQLLAIMSGTFMGLTR